MNNEETTLFVIETSNYNTWYVDYCEATGNYDVHKNEKFRVRRKSLGEALEYIFNTLGSTHLKLVKYEAANNIQGLC